MEYFGHKIITDSTKSQKCEVCGIKVHRMYSDGGDIKGDEFYYRMPDAPNNQSYTRLNITCDEVIIKKIIE